MRRVRGHHGNRAGSTCGGGAGGERLLVRGGAAQKHRWLQRLKDRELDIEAEFKVIIH